MPNHNPKTVHILYFASLASLANRDEETIQVAEDADLAQIYTQLATQYQFSLERPRLAVAINHEICNWQTPVKPGDIVAFIPPVAGG